MIHALLPDDIDDPRSPSGGNAYDRQLLDRLVGLGWPVTEHAVPGDWPTPTAAQRADLAALLATVPADAPLLVDGLVGSAVPEVLLPRPRLVVLVHMPLGGGAERATLAGAAAVVTTSEWTRGRLLAAYGLAAGQVHAAPPGVDPAPLVPGSAAGSALLCVGAVTRLKGQDLLVAALATMPELAWNCVCVGSLTREPDFAAGLRSAGPDVPGPGTARVRFPGPPTAPGPAARVRFAGPLTGAALAAAYGAADLLVLPSHAETYGMVVTEALARGLPVLVTEVGGLPEAVGTAPDGSRPGLLVPPGDGAALAAALRRWLTDAGLRDRLRRSARGRRDTLTGWDVTAARVSRVLAAV